METARMVEQAIWNVIRTKTFFLLLQNISTCWDLQSSLSTIDAYFK